jgi:hypothetical protein
MSITPNHVVSADPDGVAATQLPAPEWPAGARFMERLVVTHEGEEEVWYTVWLPPGAPLPAGALETGPRYEPRGRLGEAAAVTLVLLLIAVLHLVSLLEFHRWEIVPLVLAGVVAASFYVPAGRAHDAALPARFVRVRELPVETGVTAVHRVGLWLQENEWALICLPAGAWMAVGALAGTYGLLTGAIGAVFLLRAGLDLTGIGRSDGDETDGETGSALLRVVRQGLGTLAAVGAGVLLEIWYFETFFSDAPRWLLAILPAFYLLSKSDLRLGDVFPSLARGGGKPAGVPVPRRALLGVGGRIVCGVLALLVAVPAMRLAGPLALGMDSVVALVLFVLMMVLAIVALLGGPRIPVVDRSDPYREPVLESELPRAARIWAAAAGAVLMLGGMAFTAADITWGLLGFFFGITALVIALTGGETYVHYRVVAPEGSDETGATLALAPAPAEG